MASKILQVFLVIVLLSLPTSGQNSQQHLICKNVESVFSDGHDVSTISHRRTIQGSPGKRGPAGVKGERGLHGVQGVAGSPAVVDYEQIFEKIENKTRQGLREMRSRSEECQRNVTELQAEVERMNGMIATISKLLRRTINSQICRDEGGLSLSGKCYFTPQISSSGNMNYNQAVAKCSSQGASIAEFHSVIPQQAIEDFFRSKLPSTVIDLWIGMTYQSSGSNVLLKFGDRVSIDQFKWDNGWPSGSEDKIVIRIRKDDNDNDEGLWNRPATDTRNGVLCEKPL